MPCQLPIDCFDEIIKCLEKDKATLYSCLLVNRLWCRASVEILWGNFWNLFNRRNNCHTIPHIFSTLIACLPNESKDLLNKEGIIISAPTSKPPLFNYVSFFEALSIEGLVIILKRELIVSNNDQNLVLQEILKMFMKQISSLKILAFELNFNINITHFPGARDCLTDLSTLICSSDVHSELFHQLSQICHNIRSLNIVFRGESSNGELKDLISSQNNLKCLTLTQFWDDITLEETSPSLMKHSNTLIKLKIECVETLSFITRFTNLQELILSYEYLYCPFDELQHAIFPQLQILKISHECPDPEMLIKFLEINGKNLKEFCAIEPDNSLNLAIAKFCPNLKFLYTLFKKDEMETLKLIFKNCQQLESIDSWYGRMYLDLTVMLRLVVNQSPENFHELILRINFENPKLLPEDLEFFCSSWKSLKQHKSISMIFIKPLTYHDLDKTEKQLNKQLKEIQEYKTKKYRKVIENYKRLGVIRKFEWQREF